MMSHAKIVGIYLAGGKSKRMGVNKLILPLCNDLLGSKALETALLSALDHIIVITNPIDSLEWISPLLFSEPFLNKWSQIICSKASEGMANSLVCGVQKAVELQADGAMILLADQPFISQKLIDGLIFLFNNKCKSPDYVAASYKNIKRPPILFSKKMFPLLLKLEGDSGARSLLRGTTSQNGLIKNDDDDVQFIDIDTKEDYLAVKELLQNKCI